MNTVSSPHSSARPEVSIIIVSYNTVKLTLKAIETVYEQTKHVSFELIVLDNDSSDGSAEAIAERFPDLTLIASKKNHGFAAGNNVASKHATGEYLLLLNPDTEVYDGAIDKLVAFANENPKAGIWGGRTVFPDGSLNFASCWNRMTPWSLFSSTIGLSRAFPESEFLNPEEIGSWKRDTVREVDIVVGCFFLIKKDMWEELGGFDESYFMYGEETDLCLKMRKKGYRPMITPDATIMHIVGASANTRFDQILMITRAHVTLIRRHWSWYTRWFGLLMILLRVFARRQAFVFASMLNKQKYGSKRDGWDFLWIKRSEWFKGYERKVETSGS